MDREKASLLVILSWEGLLRFVAQEGVRGGAEPKHLSRPFDRPAGLFKRYVILQERQSMDHMAVSAMQGHGSPWHIRHRGYVSFDLQGT
ncbi:hypothetical protein [Bradyrhizobium sp. STM 3843]|uniref:hypothetical protein n=1 Tax=Bradyrhizobium sp. STM 3843 TaxID=551947 RepID=UPI0011127B20|nr:hypothetical protein [Bradyrhizobium sp. STM 3843]